MFEYLGLAANTFVYILLRALLSRSIAYARYDFITVVGLVLGCSEVLYISSLANRGDDLLVVGVVAVSGTLACLTSVFLTRSFGDKL